MKVTIALLMLFSLLGYAVYDSRRDQAAEAAALDRICAAERNGQPAESKEALPRRNMACISWIDPATPDIQTPQG